MPKQLDLSNEVVRSAIRELEKLDSIIVMDKAHLLLVASGVKPAMSTEFLTDPVETGGRALTEDATTQAMLTEIITKLGLVYQRESSLFEGAIDNTPYRKQRIIFYVAPRMSTIDRLIQARRDNDDKNEGLILGFPESAVNAYVKGNVLKISDLPESTKRVTAEEMRLLNHALSRDNWENEVTYLPEYALAIKHASPKIYEQCVATDASA